jgi:hypothetical protein
LLCVGLGATPILVQGLSGAPERHKRRHVRLVGLRGALVGYRIARVTIVLLHVRIAAIVVVPSLRLLAMMVI